MAIELLTPLYALHRPDDAPQKVRRSVTQVTSAAGNFEVHAHAPEPVGEHPLNLHFESPAEVAVFQAWFGRMFGALTPFWCPSYHCDLIPIGTIAAIDTSFNIKSIQYTTLYFPGVKRRAIIFLREDGTFLKRVITGSVDNGDGTETITINEALGEIFTQNNANGICFLWYGRLADDVAKLEWSDANRCDVSLRMIEMADSTFDPGASGEGGPDGGVLEPCTEGEIAVDEIWDYVDTQTARNNWPSTAAFATGAPSGGTGGTFSINATLNIPIASVGYVYHGQSFLLEPNSNYDISGQLSLDVSIGSPDSEGIRVNGNLIGASDGTGNPVPFSGSFTTDATGIALIEFGIFNREYPSLGPFIFTIWPILVTRTCP